MAHGKYRREFLAEMGGVDCEWVDYFGRMGETLRLDLRNGPWVAGGLVARAVTGQLGDGTPDTDIDVFSRTKEQGLDLAARLMGEELVGLFSPKGSSPIVGSLKQGPVVKIQIVLGTLYDDVYSMLDDFPFTATQFATDGDVVVYNAAAIAHIHSRELHVEKVKAASKAIVNKYVAKYGYKMSLQLENLYPELKETSDVSGDDDPGFGLCHPSRQRPMPAWDGGVPF